MSPRADFGPVTVHFGDKTGKYPDGNQVIVRGSHERVAFDTPQVANRIGAEFDGVAQTTHAPVNRETHPLFVPQALKCGG